MKLSRAPAAPRAARLSFLRELFSGRPDFPIDVALVDVAAVAVERALPGGNGFIESIELEQHVAKMILDNGIPGELIGGALQIVECQCEVAGLVVRPPKTVEIRSVLRLDRQRAFDEIDRLIELVTP